MVFTVNKVSYNTDDILFINTAYKVMGSYVIEIYLRSKDKPLVLEYGNKSKYDNVVENLKEKITIV